MRSLIVLAAFATAMCSGITSSHAFGDARWCEVKNLGSDVVWNCQYSTVEECTPHVIAGDRSFCNLNPYWRDIATPAASSRKHQKPQG